MKHKRIIALIAAAFLWGPVPRAFAIEVDPSKLELDIYGRSQMLGVTEMVPDPFRDDTRVYLFQKQARIGIRGLYDDVKFDTQFAFGGESANGSNTDLSLLDFVVDVPLKFLGDGTGVKVGQFRVPYSREGLTDRGTMNFGERSLMNMASYQSRDYGVALQRYSGAFAGTFGIFSSGGRDVPQRYLPEELGIPEMVLRVGYNDGVDEDIYHVTASDLKLNRTAKAVYINGLYTRDTKIGHSTAVNVRTIDKNLLVDSSYNPFINSGPAGANGNAQTLKAGDIWFAGTDAVLRHPLGNGKSVGIEAEVNYGGYSNLYGSLHIAAGRVQTSYRTDPLEFSIRYALLKMDPKVRYRTAGTFHDPMLTKSIQEIAPSAAWYIKGHNMKLVLDAPVYLQMPVFIENGVGSYTLVDQPGQISYIATAGNKVERHTVVDGRLMFQFMF